MLACSLNPCLFSQTKVVVASWELGVSRIGDSNGICIQHRTMHKSPWKWNRFHGSPLTTAPSMTHAHSLQKQKLTTYSEAVWLAVLLDEPALCLSHSSHRQILVRQPLTRTNTTACSPIRSLTNRPRGVESSSAQTCVSRSLRPSRAFPAPVALSAKHIPVPQHHTNATLLHASPSRQVNCS